MALSTATELKTAVTNWIADQDLSGSADDFVTLAEDHFDLNLRHRKMETSVDLSPTAGVFTLPTDYQHYISVVEKASTRRQLKYMSRQEVETKYPTRPSGLGCDFTITGETLTVYPTITTDIELIYVQKIPSLNDNATNWLLDNTPGLYLNACQLMALQYANEIGTPRYNAVATLTQTLIDDLNEQSEMASYAKAPRRAGGGYRP